MADGHTLRTANEADSSGVHYVTEFALTPSSADATLLAMSFTAVQAQAKLLHKALWRLFVWVGSVSWAGSSPNSTVRT